MSARSAMAIISLRREMQGPGQPAARSRQDCGFDAKQKELRDKSLICLSEFATHADVARMNWPRLDEEWQGWDRCARAHAPRAMRQNHAQACARAHLRSSPSARVVVGAYERKCRPRCALHIRMFMSRRMLTHMHITRRLRTHADTRTAIPAGRFVHLH